MRTRPATPCGDSRRWPDVGRRPARGPRAGAVHIGHRRRRPPGTAPGRPPRHPSGRSSSMAWPTTSPSRRGLRIPSSSRREEPSSRRARSRRSRRRSPSGRMFRMPCFERGPEAPDDADEPAVAAACPPPWAPMFAGFGAAVDMPDRSPRRPATAPRSCRPPPRIGPRSSVVPLAPRLPVRLAAVRSRGHRGIGRGGSRASDGPSSQRVEAGSPGRRQLLDVISALATAVRAGTFPRTGAVLAAVEVLSGSFRPSGSRRTGCPGTRPDPALRRWAIDPGGPDAGRGRRPPAAPPDRGALPAALDQLAATLRAVVRPPASSGR